MKSVVGANVPLMARRRIVWPLACDSVTLLVLYLVVILVGSASGQSSTGGPSLPSSSDPTPTTTTTAAAAPPPPSSVAPASSNATADATRQRLGTPCNVTANCPIANSVCVNQSCVCKEGFTTHTNATARPSCVSHQPVVATPTSGGGGGGGGGGGKKHQNYQPSQGENMIPMIVCLAIMFVGMCVALQLFSRARFRNQRSVFNSPNPRLLHLMKADRHDSKKRRHSHAGTGSRRPSCASNMSIPRGSRPGSTMGSRAASPDLRKQAALNSVAVVDMQATAAATAADDAKANSTELAALVRARADAERADV
ncbi:hypothetical protein BIW11_01784 [Tropilaelaps mercedesae]|uniref:EB domain-containing protein n=1 Tax=Tropilaelaps mercedesae TaxID=418985 RepID=A0A1V9X8S8_9ACAR|nr:hypothetical protein BIW11_01784 [Tropilaelaps mercedesae]